jgi:hypothetical protein
MRLLPILILLIVLPGLSYSGNTKFKEVLHWTDPIQVQVSGKSTQNYFHFSEAQRNAELDYLPEFSKLIALNSNDEIISVKIINPKYETFANPIPKGTSGISFIVSQIDVRFHHSLIRKKKYGRITFVPLRTNPNTGAIEKLVSFELSVTTSPQRTNTTFATKQKAATNSVLANGTWYKFGVTQDGVYRLSYEFLNALGVDLSALPVQNLRIYGNGGGMLPERNADFRYDDLQENAIKTVDNNNNGIFDKNDYLLFFGQSPHRWKYDDQERSFRHETHRYSDTTYYFLTPDLGPGKRIADLPSSSAPITHNVTSFNDYRVHESDAINLVKSGRSWFGETFDAITTYNFTFDFPHLSLSDSVEINVRAAAKSKSISTFTINADGSVLKIDIPTVSFLYPSPGGAGGRQRRYFVPKSRLIKVGVTYNKPLSSSRGWMDYIEINARSNLSLSGNQLTWRDQRSVGPLNVTKFTISNTTSTTMVWDVTDPLNVRNQLASTAPGSTFSFITNTASLKEFVTFNTFIENATPLGMVPNQNLHGLDQQDYVMVVHPLFENVASQLADYHRNRGLRVVIVSPQQIYNEFSSGAQDLVAIRSFVKLFYDRATTDADLPKYLLLFGDGSYDNKHRVSGNTNFIPTYQSVESFNLPTSYVSDDYFGLLDTNEGIWNLNEDVDIGIGRFPVQSVEEAQGIVTKIINYKSSPTMRDWRNEICFVGDDEDRTLHMSQAEDLADTVQANHPVYNLNKIYLDAYKQVSTPGGQRYPEAENALNRAVERGALVINYTGHGGETGWAHEQLLEIADITGWSNNEQLPLFVTATCEFSRFDDPKRISGGEHILLNPKGGGIALFTTVRTVYAGDNFNLNRKLYANLFDLKTTDGLRLGDIFRRIKNLNNTINTRNFTLLGDPALELNFPEHNILTATVNGQSITTIDTVKALEKVTITGYVADQTGNKLASYNGTLYPTIFDKELIVNTLDNDGSGVFKFNLQKNKLFKGKVSVKNGNFSFSFIIPKDISYEFGNGKISYYSENGITDGNGFSKDIIIGGTSDSAANDQIGPAIELYMNDETFVYGGITDEHPTLIAKLSDEHGINMVGTGLGHDIIATIDKNTEDAIVLNDFYEADIDSYQSGSVNYPFSNLSEGKHTLTLKAWDVYNNSSEKTIEFVVERNKEIEIDRVLNYPNPFTTRTEFWFDHNQPSRLLDVKIQIFTVSGKLIKTIDRLVQTEGYTQSQQNPIVWNGLDDYGDKLGRGVYIYKLVVRSRTNGTAAEKIEKLVIL